MSLASTDPPLNRQDPRVAQQFFQKCGRPQFVRQRSPLQSEFKFARPIRVCNRRGADPVSRLANSGAYLILSRFLGIRRQAEDRVLFLLHAVIKLPETR